MKKMLMMIMLTALLTGTAWKQNLLLASTNGEQTFEFLGKSGHTLWVAEDIGGEYCRSVLHLIVIEPDRAAAGASGLKEYQRWEPIRELMSHLEREQAVPLKKLADGTLAQAALGLKIAAPLPDAAMMERFSEHIRTGGSNALTWAAALGRPYIQPPRTGDHPAEILYSLPAGLYVNYSLDRGWYFPRSGLVLLLTHQPTRAVGLDTMHGLIVLTLKEEKKDA